MSETLIKLNIGSGENKIEGCVNIDMEESAKPDLVLDIRTSPLPYYDKTVEEINCFHNIEHIEKKHWHHVFNEFNRVLKVGGELFLAYPEFELCAKNFLENHMGRRDFWEATLYGMQRYPGDYHVVPMHTPTFVKTLMDYGFSEIRHIPEPSEPYNTFLSCEKAFDRMSKIDVLRKDVFHIKEEEVAK